MITATVTTKGRIVIPSEIRRHLKIKKGTKLCVIESGDRIILQPLTSDYFYSMAGVLKKKGVSLTKMLKQEKARENSSDLKIIRSRKSELVRPFAVVLKDLRRRKM